MRDREGFGEGLSQSRVAVVGLGLMGGSIAMALKGACAGIDGVDQDPKIVEMAKEQGVVERASCDPKAILPDANLVILATPVQSIIRYLDQLADIHPGSPIILDLGSTKREIIQAMAGLPSRFDPVGGHPMCGKEKTGFRNADKDLFRQATFALTPLPRTSPKARAAAVSLVHAIGAEPLWIDAESHDRWTASTSHLPYVLACSLAKATPDEARPLVGPGFRSTTRVAGTSSKVMLDILMTNKDALLEALNGFRDELDRLEDLIHRENWEQLASELDQASDQYRLFTGGVS